ncbi:membrane fusion protein (multidrug efflux system) [Parvibaculum indicum]|uniref:efflux RND transporter periplasmic adaptor subunit n=1 Tax=Parvibaculum indicum TaxID=562969 RepID=UPI001421ACBB|nr:efflux RND transporter periplasmic adaptor subunit [Parvibaculum indicum]NIJ40720.1 membrane fusion protein (multidrug efflux system) [Parvibaculum indicum]
MPRRFRFFLAGLIALWALPAAAAEQRPPVAVATATLQRFVDRVEAIGTTRSNETVDITSNVTEKVVEIGFDDGDRVKEGQLLVGLERAEEEAAVRAADARRVEAETAYDRARKLESRQYATTASLDERRSALEEATANLEAARSRLADRQIRAPFDGVVGLRNISPGALVTPGTVITTLDDLDPIKLDFSVPATHISELVAGLEIEATSEALGGETFRGEISSVSPRVDPATRSTMARAVLPNPDLRIKPGLLMTVELMKRPRQGVVVPEEALLPEGEKNFVFVVHRARDNEVERREVKIGGRRPGQVEILQGLDAGDLLVTHGAMRLRNGDHVRVLGETKPGQSIRELIKSADRADATQVEKLQ